MAQITDSIFNRGRKDCIKQLNKTVSHVHMNPDVVLKYPKLDKDSLRLRMSADASFASNRDETSQLGFVIFLSDKHDNCQPMVWASYKAKRVTRSVPGAETMALAEAFDAAYSHKHDVQGILKKEVPITLYTDSLSLLDVISKSTMPREKRLAIDIEAMKRAYKRRDVETIAFIRTDVNPADALNKVIDPNALMSILKSEILQHDVEQWVERRK
jgi:hypothetical protein